MTKRQLIRKVSHLTHQELIIKSQMEIIVQIQQSMYNKVINHTASYTDYLRYLHATTLSDQYIQKMKTFEKASNKTLQKLKSNYLN